ncbi:hypothetical protein [Agarivorans gilvus]|uniref:Uncharacterized protein n=1 Tax=Agarivorans gilvus TaxID=680279 RepID=A0ABQ1I4J1_9ALTE|nr:hypothetical protein [Agarivorans gilvus]GGB11412.1 hypothetical protein GCM10007414_26130 [Agarivorans gilvus]
MFGIHKVKVVDLFIESEKKQVIPFTASCAVYLTQKLIDLKLTYATGEKKSGFFGGMINKDINYRNSGLDDWEIISNLDGSESAAKLKGLGVASLVGYGLAGPAGAVVTGLLSANKKDIPIMLVHKPSKQAFHCMAKHNFAKEVQESEWVRDVVESQK